MKPDLLHSLPPSNRITDSCQCHKSQPTGLCICQHWFSPGLYVNTKTTTEYGWWQILYLEQRSHVHWIKVIHTSWSHSVYHMVVNPS